MVSFDIFNTLITRTVLAPQGIFALMQRELASRAEFSDLPMHVKESFATLRVQAEALARLSNQCRGLEEVSLQDIYEAMAMHGNMSAEMQGRLCKLECELECANVLPIPQNIALLKEKLMQGERVVLISDMYLPGEIIRRMITKADEALGQIPLYVSADLGVRKTTGNLYRKVAQLEQAVYAEWTHYGDDLFQDIQKAGELGIETIHLAEELPVALEQSLSERHWDSPLFQLLSGIARYTRYMERLKNPVLAERTESSADMSAVNMGLKENYHATAYEMGSSVSAPILYSYADWMVQEAVEKGIKRLYFIARDGYFPKLITDKIIAKRHLDIATFYLYGSRKAWRFCSLSEEKFNLRELVVWSYPSRIDSVWKLASLLELSVEELLPFLPYGCQGADTRLENSVLYELVERLEKSVPFRRFYLEKQSEKKNMAAAYIRQEVDTRDDRFAFVDVSGGGLTQGCLHSLMSSDYQKPITTFFFKLDRVNLVSGCIYDVFFPSMLENNLVIEMVCRAPHGQTLRYERKEEKIVPVLDSFEEESLTEHGFAELERAIGDYADNMLAAAKGQPLQGGVISVVADYLNYVAHRPDERVLEYFASFPNNESGRESSLREYAPKLTEEEILTIFLRRMYWEPVDKYYKGTNLEYSLLRCEAKERALAEWCRQNYDSERGRLLRMERQQEEDELREKYGRAVYYPCELLEKNLVVYGAGRFGQKLYRRLRDMGIYNIVKWVDKKLSGEYPAEVDTVESIATAAYDQVVIAVMNQDMAEEIAKELIDRGVPKDKLFWRSTYLWTDWNALIYGGKREK